jgi:hypothetical protein
MAGLRISSASASSPVLNSSVNRRDSSLFASDISDLSRSPVQQTLDRSQRYGRSHTTDTPELWDLCRPIWRPLLPEATRVIASGTIAAPMSSAVHRDLERAAQWERPRTTWRRS